ncbi:membrane protein [Streptococcus pseudoporcinus]|uniref:Membrane protein n=1 Tax=Streptococcus pseudoporcinus TaxID=361101 RepID=A0A4U9ZBN4_9STRE|nr:ABC transporter permease subunit [Streptococcus pseudoporcinus]VTS36996.1 membrane protein [Streptococcus pseudoporcinus]
MIIKHELQENKKSLLIWAFSVGISSALCILLYETIADSVKDIAYLYQDMGGVSKALGMDKVSIATLNGYYSSEIALIYSIGAAMFSAMLGISMLSNEEEAHTAEFLFSLPISRQKVFRKKFLSILILLILFNIIAIALEYLTLYKVGMAFDYRAFAQYHSLVLIMQIEIASICFMISAFAKKKLVGLGMGLALFGYFMDLICRLIDKVDSLKYITPYYYANATDRFAGTELDAVMLVIATTMIIVSYLIGLFIFSRRDLAS